MEYVMGGMAAAAVAFGVVWLITPVLTRYLAAKNATVPDRHKRPGVTVARPGGPAIIAGILASEGVLYLFAPSASILAIMATSLLAFVVGIVDDMRVMGGWFKPLALVGAAVPIILLGAYETNLAFPLFGEVQIPLLYLGIIALMIPITGNTINSIDVLNGVASGFMAIAGAALTISLIIMQNYEVAAASAPLVFVSLAFYRFHRLPSRIFPGDSGALAFGAMYGVIAIVGEVEIIAAIALLPAVINSFLFLASVRRIVEHREIKAKPVSVTDELKLEATKDPAAPVTLVRIIVSRHPMSERQVAFVIFRLAVFAGALAVISALLMGVRL